MPTARAKRDFAKNVMGDAGNRDATVRLFPQLSHVLSPDIIGSLQAWSWLETLAAWAKAKL
jgi:hypothetical protein